MKTVRLMLMAAAAVVLTGCGNRSDSDDDSRRFGKLGIGVTDGPVDEAERVQIRFNGLEIKPAEGEPQTILFSTPKDIDLLALQGVNAAPLISDEEVLAGEYQWLRLMVAAEFDNVMDSYIEINGMQFELQVPSGSETGLKLNTGFVVPQGGAANYTIDFDLRKSLVEPTGQPGYFLKPVLRMVNNVDVGTLVGNIDPVLVALACEGTALGAVYVYAGADVVPDDVGSSTEPLTSGMVTEVAADGFVYEIGFLAAGTYTVAYTCDALLDTAESDESLLFFGAQNVIITANTTTTVNFSPAVPTI